MCPRKCAKKISSIYRFAQLEQTNTHTCSLIVDSRSPSLITKKKKDSFVGVNLSYTQNIELFVLFVVVENGKEMTNDLLLNEEVTVNILKMQSNEIK